LSLKDVPSGRLIRCFAGCPTSDIVNTIEALWRAGHRPERLPKLGAMEVTDVIDFSEIVTRIVRECLPAESQRVRAICTMRAA
jgi:hypothetical protein